MWTKYIVSTYRDDSVDILWISNVDNMHRDDVLL